MTKYAIVPVEPSEEMTNSGRIVIGEDAEMNPAHLQDGEVREVWAAMLASAPPSDLVAVPRELLAKFCDHTRPDYVGAPVKGRHWQCYVTADDIAELRALLSTTATGEG